MNNEKKIYVDMVNVFGTIYKVYLFDYYCSYLGLTDTTNKEILISSDLEYSQILETIAHEVLHAMLYECGMQQYCDDEILVKWFGFNFIKLNNKVCNLSDSVLKSQKEYLKKEHKK